MQTKYIVAEFPIGALPVMAAVVFPASLPHATIVDGANLQKEDLISAGFFRVVDGQVEPYGESTGLGLSSRPQDAVLIARAIGLHPSSR